MYQQQVVTDLYNIRQEVENKTMMTRPRNRNRNRNGTVKTIPQRKLRTSTFSCKMMTWNRRWNLDTALREDRLDRPVVASSVSYRDTADDILDRELIQYYPDPPKYDNSPRSSMHIFDLSTATSGAFLRENYAMGSISPSKLPVIGVGVPQRKVQFANPEENKVYYVDYTSTASSTWYNRMDYVSFKRDLKDTIIALYRTKGRLYTLDQHQYTFLGLERSLTYLQVTGRKKLYTMYVQMIVQQQQQEYCKNDPLQLRHISMMYSNSSVRRAQIRGIIDGS